MLYIKVLAVHVTLTLVVFIVFCLSESFKLFQKIVFQSSSVIHNFFPKVGF